MAEESAPLLKLIMEEAIPAAAVGAAKMMGEGMAKAGKIVGDATAKVKDLAPRGDVGAHESSAALEGSLTERKAQALARGIERDPSPSAANVTTALAAVGQDVDYKPIESNLTTAMSKEYVAASVDLNLQQLQIGGR